ncbi:tetratricopeptide repeat protein [Spongiactinospora rosea]|uniref:tetratricopeptide repeat protein n=1 Tax=Spongiactinospora rosea TaxID=2248750 RepID=UPI0018F35743|nr:tetratricopeptide repeat protein [Spongiactinospora rosea]
MDRDREQTARPPRPGPVAAWVPRNPDNPREWCVSAVARLNAGEPDSALEAARQALARDQRLEWAHRIESLALERLGHDQEAVESAERAVLLAPGSWPARLRSASALRRIPGRRREAWDEAAKALWFAPEEPDVRVLTGDLALLRGEHGRAAAAYRAALREAPGHPAARINLGLTLLRWERPRGHHDDDWPVDPRETGRARRALEVWSRQVRALLALALAAAMAVAAPTGLRAEARAGGLLVLVIVAALTLRQARRIRTWRYVPGMLGRDLWFGVAVGVTPLVVLAYAVAVAALPAETPGVVWAGSAGLVLGNAPALAVVRVLAEGWRGRPVRALAEFAAALPERTARRDAAVAIWILAVRAWSVTLVLAGVAAGAGRPYAGLGALLVPLALARIRRSAGLSGRTRTVLAADPSLGVALALLLVACLGLSAAVLPVPVAVWGWRTGLAALLAMALVFALRAVRAWWRGSPGPWRPSLVMCEGCGTWPPADVRPGVGLSQEVRRAFTSSRGVVLAYTDASGPRALAVGAVASVGPAGELRLIAADEAWQAAERDPKVAVFVTDPMERRFWAEVRGIALGDPEAEVLRVTPKEVVIGEYPGRHQGRHHGDRPGRA